MFLIYSKYTHIYLFLTSFRLQNEKNRAKLQLFFHIHKKSYIFFFENHTILPLNDTYNSLLTRARYIFMV